MTAVTETAAHGKVIEVKDSTIVFTPAGTNYRMHLAVGGPYTGAINKPVSGAVRVTARKVYTVPSGGNFITPLFGQPRILQGRVLQVDDKSMVIHAGLPIVVDLPSAESAIDLDRGQIGVGALVNVVAMPQARFSVTDNPAGRA